MADNDTDKRQKRHPRHAEARKSDSHERIAVGHVDQRLANAGDEHNRAKRIDREAAGTDGGK
jgi:hypothetical protein